MYKPATTMLCQRMLTADGKFPGRVGRVAHHGKVPEDGGHKDNLALDAVVHHALGRGLHNSFRGTFSHRGSGGMLTRADHAWAQYVSCMPSIICSSLCSTKKPGRERPAQRKMASGHLPPWGTVDASSETAASRGWSIENE